MRETEGDSSCFLGSSIVLMTGAASRCRVTDIFMMKAWHDRRSKTTAETMMCDWDWEGRSRS